jgi:hypothetical protein
MTDHYVYCLECGWTGNSLRCTDPKGVGLFPTCPRCDGPVEPIEPIDPPKVLGAQIGAADWNRCPRCNELVDQDGDGVSDGSESFCHNCRITLVVVELTDGTWRLSEYDSDRFDPPTTTARGFRLIEFRDAYGHACSLQQSSIADYEAVWLGIESADPKVMARDAESVGLVTAETVGWIPYPVPEEVLMTTRMHLDRECVEGLIERLQAWLKTGEIGTEAT